MTEEPVASLLPGPLGEDFSELARGGLDVVEVALAQGYVLGSDWLQVCARITNEKRLYFH
jgi:hypothetical protein